MSNEMFGELPVYTLNDRRAELGLPPVEVRKAFQNDLCVQINRLMDHFGIEAADIVRGTSLTHSTISGWINSKVDAQMLDSNVKELARFFGVSLDYLAFSVPVTERDFEVERAMEESEEKKRNDISA